MSFKPVVFLILAALFSSVVAADTIFFGTLGDLGAAAKFELLGGNLQITLSNTSTDDVGVPSEVLTALFFDIDGNQSLFPISALLGLGSVVWFGTTDPGGVVGGQWAYASGLSGAPGGARHPPPGCVALSDSHPPPGPNSVARNALTAGEMLRKAPAASG